MEETQKTVNALQSNFLAKESNLYIFSDGPRNDQDNKKITKIREYIHTISGFNSVIVIESVKNKGLANSIIEGVTKVICKYGKAIVLEDDLITIPNFLEFMNQALTYYKDIPKIFSISGYSMNLPSLKHTKKDYYLGYRASSWGWGTWLDRWEKVDWEVKDYDHFKKNPLKQMRFIRGGSDMPGMLRNQMNGRIDSWAIRWCYHQFNEDLLTLFPSKSKLKSIGFGSEATHTKQTFRFDTNLDCGTQQKFTFNNSTLLEKPLIKEFQSKFSIRSRLMDKFNFFK
jgi:hypothetical protein